MPNAPQLDFGATVTSMLVALEPFWSICVAFSALALVSLTNGKTYKGARTRKNKFPERSLIRAPVRSQL